MRTWLRGLGAPLRATPGAALSYSALLAVSQHQANQGLISVAHSLWERLITCHLERKSLILLNTPTAEAI